MSAIYTSIQVVVVVVLVSERLFLCAKTLWDREKNDYLSNSVAEDPVSERNGGRRVRLSGGGQPTLPLRRIHQRECGHEERERAALNDRQPDAECGLEKSADAGCEENGRYECTLRDGILFDAERVREHQRYHHCGAELHQVVLHKRMSLRTLTIQVI